MSAFIKKEIFLAPRIVMSWTLLVLVGILIPIWSIPHTMAARNISLGASLLALCFSRFDWRIYKNQLNIFYLFTGYLLIHLLFFSIDIKIALHNFRSEWLKFILCFILGLGTALAVHRCQLSKALLWVGALFTIPLFVHLLLVLNVWRINFQVFPWGYLGINTFHGELGYASLAATIFLGVYLNFQASKVWEYVFVLACLIVCIFSLAVAQSRGGLTFSIFAILMITTCAIFKKSHKSNMMFRHWFFIMPLLLIITTTAFLAVTADLTRWQSTAGKLKMGAIASINSFEIACKGVGVLSTQLSKSQPLDSETKEQIMSVFDGDGARVIGLVTGLGLIMENPMGIDQSRQAYQIALKKYCQGQPGTILSHAHNGWINTALAVGIPGTLLLFSLFLQVIKIAYQGMNKNNCLNPFSIALFFSSCIWLLRAMIDGTMQDQSLEMQAFILALLLGLTLQGNANAMTNSCSVQSK